jgi:hypothetical protein
LLTAISPFAPVKSLSATSSGINALRAGSNSDAGPACAAMTRYTSGSLPTPATSSSGAATTCPAHTAQSITRRFHRSASTPATGLSSTAGSKPSTTLAAAEAADPVDW